MAVSSLRYRPNASQVEESKAGYVVFSGDAHEYHYWHVRTMLKLELIPTLPEVKEVETLKSEEGDAADTEKSTDAYDSMVYER